jgi:predicted RNA binding protein YcfA (HicA-like mRNA interferase family)
MPIPRSRASKAKELLKVLEREPLNYRVVRQSGSHRRLKAPGRPTITFAFHDGRSLAPSEVRAVLALSGRRMTVRT